MNIDDIHIDKIDLSNTPIWLHQLGESDNEYTAFKCFVTSAEYVSPTVLCTKLGLDYKVQYANRWSERADAYYEHKSTSLGYSQDTAKKILREEGLKIAFESLRPRKTTTITRQYIEDGRKVTETETEHLPDGKLVLAIIQNIFNDAPSATLDEISALLQAMVHDGSSGSESQDTVSVAQ